MPAGAEARESAGGDARTRERLALLLALTADLLDAVTVGDVTRIAIGRALAVLPPGGAAALWLREEGGLRLVEAAGLPDPERARLDPLPAGGPEDEALRRGEPVFVSGPEVVARAPGRFAPGPPASLACLPLVAKEGCLGLVSLSFPGGGPFGAEVRSFLALAAHHVAQALAHARLYEAERRARSQAQQAMAAREEVVSIVSHDLKNPLNAVLMSAGLLRRAQEPARVRHHAEAIERAVDRMRHLVHDLLDLARLEAGHFALDRQAHPARALLQDAVALLQPLAAAKGLTLAADEAEAAAFRALCDRERALQVLQNLVGNAIAFTPPGGRVTLGARGDGAEVVLWVADTGPGIRPEERELVFERFWKSRASRGGTGLGLSIAKGIAEAHGGRIWVESRPGEGACFLFTLPAARGD